MSGGCAGKSVKCGALVVRCGLLAPAISGNMDNLGDCGNARNCSLAGTRSGSSFADC